MERSLDQIRTNRLLHYDPYPKQIAFHEAGIDHPFRLFMAGNQLGKSDCGGAEFAAHVTGRYPLNWIGRRFTTPIIAWAGSDTNETTREIVQAKLFGEEGEEGTGFIPPECIGKISLSRQGGGSYNRVQVKHTSGGWSTIVFKSYEQGRRKWQGKGVHVIWCDEEPPEDIWSEATARVTATNGLIMLTFTPLEGLSEVVRSFYPHPDSVEKFIIRMEMDEAQHPDGRSHLTPEIKKKLIGRYLPHQRDARIRGLPILGSGLVYDIDDTMIIEQPCQYPDHWRHIIGLDIGGGEAPTAWAWLAHDTEVDVVHLMHVYSEVNPIIAVHASSIMARGSRIPVAWPHDAGTKDRGSGISFKALYQKHGCRMLHEHAQFSKADGGGNNVEPGVALIYNRMVEGRFKAPLTLQKFWDELRTYHRVKGIIVKKHDHVMDAIRYGIMMLRHAKPIRRLGLPTRVEGIYNPLQPQGFGNPLQPRLRIN